MDTVVYHKLGSAIRARYIRFRPTAWHGHISMRVEVYGCEGSDGFRYGIYSYSFRFSFLQNISTYRARIKFKYSYCAAIRFSFPGKDISNLLKHYRRTDFLAKQ